MRMVLRVGEARERRLWRSVLDLRIPRKLNYFWKG